MHTGYMETALVQNLTVNSGFESGEMVTVRVNITMPKKLRDCGVQRARILAFPSVSAYFQELLRSDCGDMLKTQIR
jgi:hypothetical protein